MSNDNKFFPVKAPIVALIGPTAIGKTALSIELAKKFDFEVIGVDSIQVYKYMDIGSAKITQEEMKNIPHHLIDIVNPDEPFNAGLFEEKAVKAIRGILQRGKNILLTGGTGLYLAALFNGLIPEIKKYPAIKKEIEDDLHLNGVNVLHEKLFTVDRKSAERIHKNDTQRVVRALEIFKGTGKKWSELIEEHKMVAKNRFKNVLVVGLTCERSELHKRIEQRSQLMLSNGLQKEVSSLLERGYSADLKSMQSIGYSHMIKLIEREWDKDEMLLKLARDTRRYAKRQYTWFNKIAGIQWQHKDANQDVFNIIENFIKIK